MKRMLISLATGLVMVCGWASLAETIDTHKTFLPQEIKWVAGRLFSAGAELAVLYGDPKGAGMFALRVKMPKVQHRSAHACSTGKRHSHQWQIHRGVVGRAAGGSRRHGEVLPAGSFSPLPPGRGLCARETTEFSKVRAWTGPWEKAREGHPAK